MTPFTSTVQMIDVHTAMFGDAGRFVAEAVIRFAPTMFDVALDPLRFRVVLAPDEIGAYNRHIGYTTVDENALILGNRHICRFDYKGNLVLADPQFVQDFILHELAHTRQAMLLGGRIKSGSRGVHVDIGWHGAIAEATPRYLGVSFPPSAWPKWRSVRVKGAKGTTPKKVQDDSNRLRETETSHWPHSFRKLIAAGDPRLTRVAVAA